MSEKRLIDYLEKVIKKNRIRYKKWSNNNLARGLNNGSPETAIKALDAITFKIESYKEKYLEEDLRMTKTICQRWAIVNFRTNKEIGNLGWFTNYSRDNVLEFCKTKRIMIDEDEDVKVVEEY